MLPDTRTAPEGTGFSIVLKKPQISGMSGATASE
jgi:hypothetical protein